jgi:hypothetical protein
MAVARLLAQPVAILRQANRAKGNNTRASPSVTRLPFRDWGKSVLLKSIDCGVREVCLRLFREGR